MLVNIFFIGMPVALFAFNFIHRYLVLSGKINKYNITDSSSEFGFLSFFMALIWPITLLVVFSWWLINKAVKEIVSSEKNENS